MKPVKTEQDDENKTKDYAIPLKYIYIVPNQ